MGGNNLPSWSAWKPTQASNNYSRPKSGSIGFGHNVAKQHWLTLAKKPKIIQP
jgi:hypothetical protein